MEYFRIFYEEDPLGLNLGVEKLAYMTKPIGNIDIDHIWYWKMNDTQSVLSFVSALDSLSWTALMTSISSVSLVTSDFAMSKIGNSFFLAITALIVYSSHYNLKRYKRVIKYLILLWLTATMLLQLLFGGDLAANLAMEAKAILIDSFDDLRNKNISIYGVKMEMIEKSNSEVYYFNPCSDYYDDFTSRLKLFNLSFAAKPGVLTEITFGLQKNKEACLIGPKSFLDYLRNHYKEGMFRESTHVSKEGGNSMFHIFCRILTADERETWAMDFV